MLDGFLSESKDGKVTNAAVEEMGCFLVGLILLSESYKSV